MEVNKNGVKTIYGIPSICYKCYFLDDNEPDISFRKGDSFCGNGLIFPIKKGECKKFRAW